MDVTVNKRGKSLVFANRKYKRKETKNVEVENHSETRNIHGTSETDNIHGTSKTLLLSLVPWHIENFPDREE